MIYFLSTSEIALQGKKREKTLVFELRYKNKLRLARSKSKQPNSRERAGGKNSRNNARLSFFPGRNVWPGKEEHKSPREADEEKKKEEEAEGDHNAQDQGEIQGAGVKTR